MKISEEGIKDPWTFILNLPLTHPFLSCSLWFFLGKPSFLQYTYCKVNTPMGNVCPVVQKMTSVLCWLLWCSQEAVKKLWLETWISVVSLADVIERPWGLGLYRWGGFTRTRSTPHPWRMHKVWCVTCVQERLAVTTTHSPSMCEGWRG